MENLFGLSWKQHRFIVESERCEWNVSFFFLFLFENRSSRSWNGLNFNCSFTFSFPKACGKMWWFAIFHLILFSHICTNIRSIEDDDVLITNFQRTHPAVCRLLLLHISFSSCWTLLIRLEKRSPPSISRQAIFSIIIIISKKKRNEINEQTFPVRAQTNESMKIDDDSGNDSSIVKRKKTQTRCVLKNN